MPEFLDLTERGVHRKFPSVKITPFAMSPVEGVSDNYVYSMLEETRHLREVVRQYQYTVNDLRKRIQRLENPAPKDDRK